MRGCFPAAPVECAGRASPVLSLVRCEYPHHLGHGLVDITAVHRTHDEEPARIVAPGRAANHPLIGTFAGSPSRACPDVRLAPESSHGPGLAAPWRGTMTSRHTDMR